MIGDFRHVRRRLFSFGRSTAIRYVIIFPETVGGDFTSYLYLTSSDRSEKGTESHIAFVRNDPPAFWICDWSIPGDTQRLVRQVPISRNGQIRLSGKRSVIPTARNPGDESNATGGEDHLDKLRSSRCV
jgi:hypothetical protein